MSLILVDMKDIGIFIIAIITILIIHIFVDLKGSNPKWLNRAIIADCIICGLYLLLWFIWN